MAFVQAATFAYAGSGSGLGFYFGCGFVGQDPVAAAVGGGRRGQRVEQIEAGREGRSVAARGYQAPL